MHEQHASSVPPPLEDPLFYSGATEYLQVINKSFEIHQY